MYAHAEKLWLFPITTLMPARLARAMTESAAYQSHQAEHEEGRPFLDSAARPNLGSNAEKKKKKKNKPSSGLRQNLRNND
jgi:hypothetical protein